MGETIILLLVRLLNYYHLAMILIHVTHFLHKTLDLGDLNFQSKEKQSKEIKIIIL